jgi:hypothetical protein
MDKKFEHAYEEYILSPQGEGRHLRVRVKSIPFKQFFRSEEDELFFNHYRFYQETVADFYRSMFCPRITGRIRLLHAAGFGMKRGYSASNFRDMKMNCLM